MKDVFDNIWAVIAVPLCIAVVVYGVWYATSSGAFALLPALSFAFLLLPLFLPIVLFYLTYNQWMYFVRTRFTYDNERVVLRLKLPAEVFKSPEAMESVFENIHAANGSDNLWQAYIDGKHPLPMTCELASIGGDVRFYMTVHKKLRNLLEAQLYAQYPGLEIVEEQVDYVAEVQWYPEEMDLMSFHVLKKKDDVLPIRTYIDYGHDKLPKEEEKFEPMSAMLEAMGTAAPHERMFVQFLCTPHRGTEFKHGDIQKKEDWGGAAKKKVNEILHRDDKGMALQGEETDSRPVITMGERDTITAIERNVSKLAFDVAVRAMYITLDSTQFDSTKIGGLLGGFKQYEVIGRNGMGPKWKTDFDYAWFQDWSGKAKVARKKDELEQYKLRKYDAGSGKANDGHQMKPMSVEEIATMFHIPGRGVVTPGVGRIPSAVGSAPSNLPVSELPQ